MCETSRKIRAEEQKCAEKIDNKTVIKCCTRRKLKRQMYKICMGDIIKIEEYSSLFVLGLGPYLSTQSLSVGFVPSSASVLLFSESPVVGGAFQGT